MLEVNNELSAGAASHSVMTVTDFHLGRRFKNTHKTMGGKRESGVRREAEEETQKRSIDRLPTLL